jgi:hypothetical protein
MGLCILDRSWYITECLRQLGTVTTYAEVPAADIPDRIEHLREQALRLIDQYGPYLPENVCNYLRAAAASDCTVPYFYLLPKVHKLPDVTHTCAPASAER